MWEKNEHILYWANDLERLARNLEKEAAKWSLPDYSKSSWDKIRIYNSTQKSFQKRTGILWLNAVESGIIIFKLCGLGAFDDQRRIKNMVSQIRSKVVKDLQKFVLTVPHDIGLHTVYSHRTQNSLDVFFVKIFEALCEITQSRENLIGFKVDYPNLKPLAKLHAKLMCQLSADLKSRFGKPSEKDSN